MMELNADLQSHLTEVPKSDRKFSVKQAEKCGQRMYQSFERQQMKKEQLKRKRDLEIASTMRSRPQICPKSARLSQIAIQKAEQVCYVPQSDVFVKETAEELS
jgi:hypothetical protein